MRPGTDQRLVVWTSELNTPGVGGPIKPVASSATQPMCSDLKKSAAKKPT
jgi:hypothetical protein